MGYPVRKRLSGEVLNRCSLHCRVGFWVYVSRVAWACLTYAISLFSD